MGGTVMNRRYYRRRKNPSSSFSGEDIAVLMVAAFGIYVAYDLVVKPAQNAENAVSNAGQCLECFLRNPFCPAFY